MTGIVKPVGMLIALTFSAATLAAGQADRRLPAPPQPGGERRLALVVGNDTYPDAPLRNARNDARAVADALADVGFR